MGCRPQGRRSSVDRGNDRPAFQNGEVFLGAHYLKPEPSGRQSVFVAQIGV
jgi:hypothetical protein